MEVAIVEDWRHIAAVILGNIAHQIWCEYGADEEI